jgi:hypothetical protein
LGPADRGRYDFDAPTRTGKHNDALVCPEGSCLSADPSLATPLFAMPPDKLYASIRARLIALPGAGIVE